MKRTPSAPRLRARLARLVSLGDPPTGRAREIRLLAERIAKATGDDVSDVLDRACEEAVARLLGEDAP
ncbi:MAG TPA: hypothetical protein VFY71_10330 [Planctomycetota bacterium]|nr:hypothetical protein [Planctomycetota bacterium]